MNKVKKDLIKKLNVYTCISVVSTLAVIACNVVARNLDLGEEVNDNE